MLPPAFAMLGGFTMLVLATTGRDELVVTDYARIEEITSERFARDRAAVQIAAHADVEIVQGADGLVTVNVELSTADTLPDALVLQLRHAADSASDRRVVLERGDGRYTGITTLPRGSYALELLPPDASWRLAGALHALPGRVTLSPIADADRTL
jgi:hypothetical protein